MKWPSLTAIKVKIMRLGRKKFGRIDSCSQFNGTNQLSVAI